MGWTGVHIQFTGHIAEPQLVPRCPRDTDHVSAIIATMRKHSRRPGGAGLWRSSRNPETLVRVDGGAPERRQRRTMLKNPAQKRLGEVGEPEWVGSACVCKDVGARALVALVVQRDVEVAAVPGTFSDDVSDSHAQVSMGARTRNVL